MFAEATITATDERENKGKENQASNNQGREDKTQDHIHSQVWIAVLAKSNDPKDSNEAESNSWNDDMAHVVQQVQPVHPQSLSIGVVVL